MSQSSAPGESWHIAVVNYRTPQLAVQSVQSAREAAPEATIVVADNASGDDSVALLEKDGSARVLALHENRGYGYALNAASRDASSPYLLLLNADVTLNRECLERLEQRFKALPNLGVVAPRLLSEDGTPQPSCRMFPSHSSLLWSRRSPLSRFTAIAETRYLRPEPSAFTLTDVVAGACMAIRLEVWHALNGMDEDFFLFAEDTDLCFRAKTGGWLVGYDPSARVEHIWGASTRLQRDRSRRLHAASLYRYFRKHYPERRLANGLLSLLLRAHARTLRLNDGNGRR